MKKCYKCNALKPKIKFSKNKTKFDGLNSECRECRKIIFYKYRTSKNGLISLMYKSQIRLSTKRGYDPPKYSKEEFFDWIINNPDFNTLYSNWEKSGFYKMEAPTVDRDDDYGIYSFENISLMSWKNNKEKGHLHIKTGKNNKQSVAVLALNDNNIIVGDYFSIHEADRQTKAGIGNIFSCCVGNRIHAGGFKWKYREDYENRK